MQNEDLIDLKKRMAKDSVVNGLMTIEEASESFALSSLDIEFELYPTKANGFYFKEVSKEGYILKPDYNGWAKYMRETRCFIATRTGSFLYNRAKKHYVSVSDIEIESILYTDSGGVVKPSHISHFIRMLLASSFDDSEDLTQPVGMLNLQNGVLDIVSKELLPHSPKRFFRYCLPVKYDESARCPNWHKFLEGIFPNHKEMPDIMAQIFGYIMHGGYQWLHKSFVLYGSGRNGKSTLLEVLQNLVGKENYVCVGLGNLDKPFSVVRLDGKIANILEETPNDRINSEIFKKATTSGMVSGAHKYKDEYEFRCDARFIFACNELPKFGENTNGMDERLYFIPFQRFFKKEERSKTIRDELAGELPGILNWAILGLSELLKTSKLPETSATIDLLIEYNKENDSVYDWASDSITKGNAEYKSTEIYDLYCNAMTHKGRKAVGDKTFFKRFKKFIESREEFNDCYENGKNSTRYKNIFITFLPRKNNASHDGNYSKSYNAWQQE